MSSETYYPGSAGDWLRYARSDLELARIDKPEGVLLESLCFHTQQAAEKALKAALIFLEIDYPKTHWVLPYQDPTIPVDLLLREPRRIERSGVNTLPGHRFRFRDSTTGFVCHDDHLADSECSELEIGGSHRT